MTEIQPPTPIFCMGMEVLDNPQTQNYIELKKIILGSSFPWTQEPIFDNTDNNFKVNTNYSQGTFFSHPFLLRPYFQERFPKPVSKFLPLVNIVLNEIFEYNKINPDFILRINANLVNPQKGKQTLQPHNDHYFPHKNMLIYLTDAGGKTFYDDVFHDPEEDDIIIFDGFPKTHYCQLPEEKNRIVIVTTYFDYEI